KCLVCSEKTDEVSKMINSLHSLNPVQTSMVFESVLKSKISSIQNEKYGFSLSIKEENDTVVYSKKIEIKAPILDLKDFSDWNKTIERVKEFYADQIILNKK
ncbi:MAG: hypothetical protein P8M17_07080, partial [Saprospiraceae bacterium]|nr:hypothetical protein [Saprospiraceae bacterium]